MVPKMFFYQLERGVWVIFLETRFTPTAPIQKSDHNFFIKKITRGSKILTYFSYLSRYNPLNINATKDFFYGNED